MPEGREAVGRLRVKPQEDEGRTKWPGRGRGKKFAGQALWAGINTLPCLLALLETMRMIFRIARQRSHQTHSGFP
jgi:hypothetical protein